MAKLKKSHNFPSIPQEEPVFKPSRHSTNLLYILITILALFSVYLFFKVRYLEQKITTQSTSPTNEQVSPLSVENLKKYAKELKLNTTKFNKCLDNGEKKAVVEEDQKYATTLGIQGTPAFFINGKFLAGAFPYEFFKEIIDKEIKGEGSANCSDYSESLQKYCQDPQNKAFDPVPKMINTGKSPSKGAVNPKVTIVEFSDFQCPFCARASTTIRKILNDYKNEVKVYYRHLPLTNIHPFAQKAAEASLCAADQGKFWEYHDKLFDLQNQK